MKSKTLATILGALCLLSLGGCLSPEASFSPLAANFKYGAPTNPADIEVYITKKPDYNYRELGIISYNTNPSQYDEAAVIQIMKKKAAQIGATGIIVMNAQSSFTQDPNVTYDFWGNVIMYDTTRTNLMHRAMAIRRE